MAYGGSQAGGPIEATAAQPHHSHRNTCPSCVCNLYTTAHRSTRSLSHWVRPVDRTRNFMVPSQIHFGCAMTGTPGFCFFFFNVRSIFFPISLSFGIYLLLLLSLHKFLLTLIKRSVSADHKYDAEKMASGCFSDSFWKYLAFPPLPSLIFP